MLEIMLSGFLVFSMESTKHDDRVFVADFALVDFPAVFFVDPRG